MPRKITIKIDGEKTTIETEGYPGMTCLSELEKLNLPYKVEAEATEPGRGMLIGQQRKTTA